MQIKRLYTFMLQQFLPLLCMTFFICLFIVMMQFLWRFIDELVGKGVSMAVVGELFFYAALSMVPTALPLAVLLASLMTFGNLGEKFELTAMKAAGISLFTILKPLIIFMVALSIGAFFFQDKVLPIAQTKMWTIMFSLRQKNPEVEIPVRTFYDQIPGMNLYVEEKNPETGMLYDMIIYDISRGLDNSRVILADSGKMNFTEDKTRLFLHLYRGEMFENLKESAMGTSSSNFLPFRRESFTDKQIYFIFDMNFNRMDESTMRSQYVGKNVAELRSSIDSINGIVDSIGDNYARELKTKSYVNVPYYKTERTDSGPVQVVRPPVALEEPLDIDSIFAGANPSAARGYINQALAKAKRQMQDYEFRSALVLEQAKLSRRHGIELIRKYTLPIACLVFFFIGAPLGAIIKKGGIGTPLVISVFLFIVYFIFDNMGFKMARDGKWEVWQGIWLSTAVMLPLGIFFTYKAVGDSQVFNLDAYKLFFQRLIGKRMERSLSMKEVIMNEVEPEKALAMLQPFLAEAQELTAYYKQPLIKRLKEKGNKERLNNQLMDIVDYLSNARQPMVITMLNRYPFDIRRKDLPSIIKTTEDLIKIYDA
ncbi:MAG: LptF/LptG family permease [Bacteroidales bacterium]|nr:LptF/LptG family permease [Bacteroidales bacterium]